MRIRWWVLASAVVWMACDGDGGGDEPEGLACQSESAAGMVCVVYGGANPPATCASHETQVEACSTDELVGTCTATRETAGVSLTTTTYYYPPLTPDTLMTTCAAAGGTYRPPGAGMDGSTSLPDAGSLPLTDELDLLIVSDSSAGMEWFQRELVDQIPTLLDRLSSGDLDGDGAPDRPGFSSIQLGVVTVDMGIGRTDVPRCDERGDDGILETTSHGSDCGTSYPSFLTWSAGQSMSSVASDFACLVQTGAEGCGFEQSLEAPLKALSPSSATGWTSSDYEAPLFDGSPPHGDGANAGFVRRDSMLAVMLFTDEDDCSAVDPAEFYDPYSTHYPGQLNLRCLSRAGLHPIQRYVDGFSQLREHPSRLAFFVLAGVPEDLMPAPGAPIAWDPLIGDPSVRDPRMEVRVNPVTGNDLRRSCSSAYPPERLLETAQGLETRGARVTVGSICKFDYLRHFPPSLTSFLVSLR